MKTSKRLRLSKEVKTVTFSTRNSMRSSSNSTSAVYLICYECDNDMRSRTRCDNEIALKHDESPNSSNEMYFV